MAKKKAESKSMADVRKIAMQLPETQEGTSCNKSAFKAGKKSFLFLGGDDDSYNLMVKLDESLPEAAKLAAKQPDNYKAGLHGWTSLVFSHGAGPPKGVLERWIEESYRLLAPKKLVTFLDGKATSAGTTKKKAVAKPAARKSTKSSTSRKPPSVKRKAAKRKTTRK